MNYQLRIGEMGCGVWGEKAEKGLKRRLYLLKSIFIKKLID
jgi:hypothetical protein